MRFYEVGGCIRDELMEKKTKDVDFAVDMSEEFPPDKFKVASDIFDIMRARLIKQGFEEFVVTPEYFTTRCRVPKDNPLYGNLLKRTSVADFVMCRVDGPYSDGRHPDYVKIGTIYDDLARRDFTVNAIARDEDGRFIDPHNGLEDIERGTLRFVGSPINRIDEDGIRVVRGMRFMVTKGLEPDFAAFGAMNSTFAADCLARPRVSRETLRDELEKMFCFDTPRSLEVISMFPKLLPVIFGKGDIRLSATMKQKFQGE